jgi:hypothetical protein
MPTEPETSGAKIMRSLPWRLLLQAVFGCVMALAAPPVMELAGVPFWLRTATAWLGIALAVVCVSLAAWFWRVRRQ